MSTTFRYSVASDFHQPLGSNKNNVFERNNSTVSSTNSLMSNNSDTNTAATAATTATSGSTTNNVKRMHSSLISKYNSNRSTIFTNDTDSISSSMSYDNNSTLASSVSPNSPANHHSGKHQHQLPSYMMNKSPQYIHQSTSRHSNLNHTNNLLHNTHSNHSQHSQHSQHILNEDLVTLNSSMDNLEDGFYKLIRLDTRISFESYYVEQKQEQYKVKLQLNKHQIDLLRYTWNQMLLEESNEDEIFDDGGIDNYDLDEEGNIEENINVYYANNDSIPGAFPTGYNNSRRRIIKRKSSRNVNGSGSTNTNTMTRLDSTTIASSLFCRQLYFNLLSKDPTLEKMFPSIKHQAANMAGILSLTISQLENLSILDEYLAKLGKLHSRVLNIEEAHFKLMGEAFVQTFQERFGSKFTKELENLWIKLYLYIANTLLQTGIDPVLKLTRYELNGSFTTSTNIDLTNGDSILLDDTDTDNDNVSVSNILDPKHQQQQYGGSSFNQDDNDNNNDGGVHPSTNTVVLTKSNILIIESVAPHHQQQKNSSGSSAATGTPTAPSKKSKFSIRKKKKENCVVM